MHISDKKLNYSHSLRTASDKFGTSWNLENVPKFEKNEYFALIHTVPILMEVL